MTERNEDLQVEFDRLAQEATDASHFDSTLRLLLEHPSYLRILEMGPAAVPMVLRRMEEERGHWFHAMMTLTGANPIPFAARGRVPEMNRVWLEWAKDNGYEW